MKILRRAINTAINAATDHLHHLGHHYGKAEKLQNQEDTVEPLRVAPSITRIFNTDGIMLQTENAKPKFQERCKCLLSGCSEIKIPGALEFSKELLENQNPPFFTQAYLAATAALNAARSSML